MHKTTLSTNKEALAYARQYIDALDAEVLLAHVQNTTREKIFAHPEHSLLKAQSETYIHAINKRIQGYSVAVIIGHREFFGLDFLVNEHTLIPRPDTEILVEAAITDISLSPTSITLIDIGTGSGCIPVSIYSQAKNNIAQIFASDISAEALTIARNNAKKYTVPITFVHGSLFEPYTQISFENPLIITANLPYLTEEQFTHESSIQREPKSALVADDHGLALIYTLIRELDTYKKTYTKNITLFLEIDPLQKEILHAFVQQNTSYKTISFKKDLASLSRVCIISW